MVPGFYTEQRSSDLHDPGIENRILELAGFGVRLAAEDSPAPEILLDREPHALRQPGACFVTLKRCGDLRGCIGSLEPSRPIALDIAANAYASARHDPRFPPLTTRELDDLEVSVSLLGPQEPLAAATRAQLVEILRPGVDGLVLRAGTHRATFLPAVWEQLPDAGGFIDALWQKARLPAGSWPKGIRFWRYRVNTLYTRLP